MSVGVIRPLQPQLVPLPGNGAILLGMVYSDSEPFDNLVIEHNKETQKALGPFHVSIVGGIVGTIGGLFLIILTLIKGADPTIAAGNAATAGLVIGIAISLISLFVFFKGLLELLKGLRTHFLISKLQARKLFEDK